MRRLLEWISRRLPEPRVIFDREGGSPYLSRYYLIGRRRTEDAIGPLRGVESVFDRLPFNLFLHHFHRSDDDGALHSHPWSWAVALVLAGGYQEERRVGDEVVRRTVRPLTLNFIHDDDFHRVDLLEQDAWSLFLVGPKTDTWYLWDRDRKARSHWRDFIEARRGFIPDARWVPDSRV